MWDSGRGRDDAIGREAIARTADAIGVPYSDAVTPRPRADARDNAEAMERFRATVEQAPVGIAHVGRDGRILFANDQLCALLGHARSELVAGPFAALAFGDDIRRGSVLQADLAAGRIPRYVIVRRRSCRDGSTPWLRLTVSAVAGPDGAPDFFIAVAEDISAAREENGAEREARERLQAALDASATGTFRWDLRTGTVQWDGHLDRLFGFPGRDVARSLDAFFARIHPDDRPRVLEHCWLRVDEGADVDVEFRVVRADGTVRWLEAKGRAIRDVHGAPTYLAGACTDVTERRQAADALQERETRFRTLADTIPQLAWMTDASGSIYWFNRRWYEYTGTALAEMRGWGWQALLHPDHVAQVVARIRRSFEVGESWEDTFPLRGRDGQYRWFLSRALPMHGTDGRMIGWFGTNTDVTDGHEAERAERAARLQAERAIHLRDEVLAVVAHDLRNPVQTVAMSAETLLELPLDEEQQRRQIGIIRRAARGMTQLIADLLDAARIEAGTLSVHQARVDVGLLLAESFEQFEEDARTRGVTLICETEAGIPNVLGDRDRLAQVLSNLLGNALKFTPPGGSVHLRSRIASPPDHRWVEVEVEDSGVGIASDHLPHIFDRFWQAVRSTRAGAGLGLAIAKGIVEAHGGHIRVESVPGQRTAFTFTIPTARRGDPDAS